MNRLDPASGQIVATPRKTGPPVALVGSAWAVPAASIVLACWLGSTQATRPTDLVVHTAVDLNLSLMLVDLWALGLAVFRKPLHTPLRVPLRTPLILSSVHLLLWFLSLSLSSFDSFYRLEPIDEVGGRYVVNAWSAAGICLMTMVSLVIAALEARLVWWVLISEKTAVVEGEAPDEGPAESDMPAGGEHLYEAQVVLHHLDYKPGEVNGEMSEATGDALKRFQASCGLRQTGELTMLTLVELRNRWLAKKDRETR